jgi:hypothetical protein
MTHRVTDIMSFGDTKASTHAQRIAEEIPRRISVQRRNDERPV